MIPQELEKEIESFEQGKKDAIYSYKTDGKYLVIAGPGTGKTYTITKRIQAILSDNENGTTADRILCLTFSNSAAREMLLDLEDKNVQNTSGITISTFHSFCLDLMEKNPDLFDLNGKSQITDFEKKLLVKKCLENLTIKYYRGENSLYGKIDDVIEVIEAFKHYRINDKETFDRNLKENPEWKNKTEDEIKKINEAWDIYQEYRRLSVNYIDFDDMINLVLKKFEENPEFLEQTAKQFDFIMVDEYQDTNKSQNDIVFQLAKHCKNILVVGDDDQIIYTFQGASLDTIDGFLKEFQNDNCKIFCITENRRSTENILRVSEKFAGLQDRYIEYYVEKIKNNKLKTDVKKDDITWFKNLKINYNIDEWDDDYTQIKFPLRLFSKPELFPNDPEFRKKLSENNLKTLIAKNDKVNKKNKPVEIHKYSDPECEKADTVRQIKEIIRDNKDVKLSEIAILVKANAEAEEYASLLKAQGIRTELVKGKNIFNANSVKLLISYMQFLNDCYHNSDKLYQFLLSKPFHINQRTYEILRDIRFGKKANAIERINAALKLSSKTEQLKDEINKLKDEIENSETVDEDKQKRLDEKIKKFEEDKKYIFKEKESKRLKKIVDDYKQLEGYKHAEYLEIFIHKMACVTGILQSYISLDINRSENIAAIKKFTDLAEEYRKTIGGDFSDFVDYIESLMASVEIYPDKSDIPLNAVQISTLHSSKGRQFEYVFMPNIVKSKYDEVDMPKEIVPLERKDFDTVKVVGKDKEEKDKDKVDDKLRQMRFLNNIKLLFVGMTRAKHTLVLSYSKEISYYIKKLQDEFQNKEEILKVIDKSDEQPDLILRNGSHEKKLRNAIDNLSMLKQFVDEKHRSEFENALKDIDSLKEYLNFTVVSPEDEIKYDYDYSADFGEYIKGNIPSDHSATSLNTFMDCPKKYLFRYILKLYPYKKRGDMEKNYSLEIGNSIHHALQKMVEYINENGQYPETSFLNNKFEEKMQDELKRDIEEIKKIIDIEEQENNLGKFYDNLKEKIKNPDKDTFKAEEEIEYDFVKEGLKFKGKIDRLDKNDDNTYNLIDYKTGKKKASSEFAPGKAHEDYYNQLAIYKKALKEKGKEIKEIKIVQPQYLLEFNLKALEGEKGDENCQKVLDNFAECIEKLKQYAKGENITQEEAGKLFCCKDDCKKDEYAFCDYKSFCKSLVI